MKKRNKILGPIVLLITAFLWGLTFVSQRLGSDYVGAYTFNAIRFIICGIVMFIIFLISHITKIKKMNDEELVNYNKNMKSDFNNKMLIIYGVFIGIFLFLGSTFQQLGITMTKNASKVGFISATYIVIVPIICMIFFKQKIRTSIWFYLLFALFGFFLISVKNGFNIEVGDFFTLLSALFYALQIAFIGRIAKKVNTLFLSSIQFLIVGTMSLIFMFIFDDLNISNIIKALPAILFAAIFSGCIAFTLQIYGQKYTDPTIASLLMSLESVFSLIFSMIILNERLIVREMIGCLIIFLSIIFAQINFKALKERKKNYASI